MIFFSLVSAQQDLITQEVKIKAGKDKIFGFSFSTDKFSLKGINIGHILSFAPGMQLKNLDQHSIFEDGVKKYLSNGMNINFDFGPLHLSPYAKYGSMIGNVSAPDELKITGNNMDGYVFQSGLSLAWPGLNYRGKFFSVSLGFNGGGQFTNGKIDQLIGFGETQESDKKLIEWSAFAGSILQSKVFFKGFGMYFSFIYNYHFGQFSGGEYNVGTGFFFPISK